MDPALLHTHPLHRFWTRIFIMSAFAYKYVDLFRSDLNNGNEKIKGYFIGMYRYVENISLLYPVL